MNFIFQILQKKKISEIGKINEISFMSQFLKLISTMFKIKFL